MSSLLCRLQKILKPKVKKKLSPRSLVNVPHRQFLAGKSHPVQNVLFFLFSPISISLESRVPNYSLSPRSDRRIYKESNNFLRRVERDSCDTPMDGDGEAGLGSLYGVSHGSNSNTNPSLRCRSHIFPNAKLNQTHPRFFHPP